MGVKERRKQGTLRVRGGWCAPSWRRSAWPSKFSAGFRDVGQLSPHESKPDSRSGCPHM